MSSRRQGRRLAAAAAAAAAAAMGPCPAWAQAAGPGWQVELGAGVETLGAGRDDWRSLDAALRGPLSDRVSIDVQARRTERFGQRDSEVGAALGWRSGEDWQLGAAATLSPTHAVLARWTGQADASRRLGNGWVAGGSLRQAQYNDAAAMTLAATAERYVDVWRFALRVSATRLDTGGDGAGLTFGIDRYIGDDARLGLQLSTGREVEADGAGGAVITRQHAAALVMRWPLGSLPIRWHLVGSAAVTRIDGAPRRTGLRLGVQHAF